MNGFQWVLPDNLRHNPTQFQASWRSCIILLRLVRVPNSSNGGANCAICRAWQMLDARAVSKNGCTRNISHVWTSENDTLVNDTLLRNDSVIRINLLNTTTSIYIYTYQWFMLTTLAMLCGCVETESIQCGASTSIT